MVAAASSRRKDLVAPCVVVREHPAVQVAERELHRSRQRGDVEDVRRAFAAGVPERVREHEPPFRVRVRDLDRLAVGRAQDVARAERVAADEVLRGCEHREHADR